jgi:DNA polymerase III delta prime subunit
MPERITLLLALAPHIKPELLDMFFIQKAATNRGYTEFGGIRGIMHGGFLPTGETVLFVLAGNDMETRLKYQEIFSSDHIFALHHILKLEPPPDNEPIWSGKLLISDEIIDFITQGYVRKPDFSRNFPAKRISTAMDWDELVLNHETMDQVQELIHWVDHEQTLMSDWGLDRILKPGYKSLFYGPSGTGKTLTASLIGKKVGKDTYRIDLSSVVSKYIGETEKNLEKIFDKTTHMDCILFFDEADALFGKRTNISDAHDRYANQEVSYLLQRIEEYPGLVILASNFKSNMDDAFLRRFQSVIYFPVPDTSERKRLWEQSFSKESSLAEDVDLNQLASKYKLTGGSIVNVVRFASLMTIAKQSTEIQKQDIIKGIRREFQKEGKTI